MYYNTNIECLTYSQTFVIGMWRETHIFFYSKYKFKNKQGVERLPELKISFYRCCLYIFAILFAIGLFVAITKILTYSHS